MKMDIESSRPRSRKTKREKVAIVIASILSCIMKSIVPILLILTTIYGGIEVARDSRRHKLSSNWALPIGVLTMASGFMFLVLGIPILANLCLNLSGNSQEEAARDEDAGERKDSRVMQLLMVVIVKLMLWWIIYTGFSLATQPRGDYRHYRLTVSVGVVAVVFGFLYFIIGIAIVLEVGLDLLGQLHRRSKKAPVTSQMLKHQWQ